MKKILVMPIVSLSLGIQVACTDVQETSSAANQSAAHVAPVCRVESFLDIPDVRIRTVAKVAAPVTHCKVVGRDWDRDKFRAIVAG